MPEAAGGAEQWAGRIQVGGTVADIERAFDRAPAGELPERLAYRLTRWKNIRLQTFIFKLARNRPNLVRRFLVGHARRMLGKQYDVVTCLEMLEHVPDPGSVVAACAKLVKPGGHVGDIGQAILANHPNRARQLAAGWAKTFPERFYVEIQRTGREQQGDLVRSIRGVIAEQADRQGQQADQQQQRQHDEWYARRHKKLQEADAILIEEIREAGYFGNGIFKFVIRGGAGIAFVADHHFRPLFITHCAGTRIGEQINKNLVAFKIK